MKKFKVFWNFDNEERWLNEMAARGHLLSRAGFRYTFAPCEPGSAVVRVDYRPSMSEEDFADYIELFQDAGWRHCSGKRGGGPQYFVASSARADPDIFSDRASRAQRYQRSITAHSALFVPLLVVTFILWTNGGLFSAPRQWYLTPGLWEMQGLEFIRAFTFETAFVIVRVGGPLLLLAVGLYSAATAVYQSIRYRKEITAQGEL